MNKIIFTNIINNKDEIINNKNKIIKPINMKDDFKQIFKKIFNDKLKKTNK